MNKEYWEKQQAKINANIERHTWEPDWDKMAKNAEEKVYFVHDLSPEERSQMQHILTQDRIERSQKRAEAQKMRDFKHMMGTSQYSTAQKEEIFKKYIKGPK